MRNFILSVSVAALMGFRPTVAHATAATPVTSGTDQATMGISLAVTTSGYEFTPLIGVLIDPPVTTTVVPRVTPLPPQGFDASVVLRNHSSEDISIALQVTGTPGDHFAFKVYNAAGTLVWDSTAGVSPDLMFLGKLKAGKAWRQTEFIPLFVNGVALPAGTYTLSVSLLGAPGFSTMTSFVVNNVIAIN
jgi:hypothetical protein